LGIGGPLPFSGKRGPTGIGVGFRGEFFSGGGPGGGGEKRRKKGGPWGGGDGEANRTKKKKRIRGPAIFGAKKGRGIPKFY